MKTTVEKKFDQYHEVWKMNFEFWMLDSLTLFICKKKHHAYDTKWATKFNFCPSCGAKVKRRP